MYVFLDVKQANICNVCNVLKKPAFILETGQRHKFFFGFD